MNEQARKLPPAQVVIPGDLWPDFRQWAQAQGLVIKDALDGDSDTEIYLLQRSDRDNP